MAKFMRLKLCENTVLVNILNIQKQTNYNFLVVDFKLILTVSPKPNLSKSLSSSQKNAPTYLLD